MADATSLPLFTYSLDGWLTNVGYEPMDQTTSQNTTNQTSTFQIVLAKYVTPLLYGLISLIGLVGNCLVIYVILSNQKMRTVTNLLLLNLAAADICFVLIVPPFTAYWTAVSQWPFGEIPCKFMHYFVNVTAYVTVYTLVLISVIRYMTVVHNVKTVRIRTRRNIVIMISATWAVILVVNIPILTSYGLKEKDPLICDIYDENSGKAIFATFFAFSYMIPLTVIAGFSLAILRHIAAQRAACTMLKRQDEKNQRTVKGKARTGKKRQAGRLLVLVVVLFALLWLPIHIVLLCAFYFGHSDSDLNVAITILCQCVAYFNSCVNPIIYNRTSKDFRDAFRQAVCCCSPRSVNGARHSTKTRGQGESLRSSPQVPVGADEGAGTADETALDKLLPNNSDREGQGSPRTEAEEQIINDSYNKELLAVVKADVSTEVCL